MCPDCTKKQRWCSNNVFNLHFIFALDFSVLCLEGDDVQNVLCSHKPRTQWKEETFIVLHSYIGIFLFQFCYCVKIYRASAATGNSSPHVCCEQRRIS